VRNEGEGGTMKILNPCGRWSAGDDGGSCCRGLKDVGGRIRFTLTSQQRDSGGSVPRGRAGQWKVAVRNVGVKDGAVGAFSGKG